MLLVKVALSIWNLLQELVIASSLAAMATMLPPPLKSPAQPLSRTGVIFHTGCHGHGVVLVVHAAGRLIALADADEPSKGVKHVVGLGQGGRGSPPIRVTAKRVFSVVGGILIVLVGDAHRSQGRRVGIVVGHEGHGRHVPLVVHLAGRLVGLADADETDEGTAHVIREGGIPDLHVVVVVQVVLHGFGVGPGFGVESLIDGEIGCVTISPDFG